MESNRKRRGFMKGKLMTFYRKAPSSSTSSVQYSSSSSSNNNKVKPSQAYASAASVGFVVHQDYVIAKPKQKVSFIVPAADHQQQQQQQFDHNQININYGVTVPSAAAGDDCIDLKAATYISSVQERFKLERINF